MCMSGTSNLRACAHKIFLLRTISVSLPTVRAKDITTAIYTIKFLRDISYTQACFSTQRERHAKAHTK